MRDSDIMAPEYGVAARYLTPAEVDGVPWILPGLFTGADFNAAAYDGIEIAPCCTWADENGELSTERADAAGDAEIGAPITMWSVYLHCIAGGVECVADFSNEPAARTFAACLMAQFGLYDDELTGMIYAAGGLSYGIQPERNIADEGEEETCFNPCADQEAEIFAIYAHAPGLGAGGCDLVHDVPSRAEAIAWINVQRARTIGTGNNSTAEG